MTSTSSIPTSNPKTSSSSATPTKPLLITVPSLLPPTQILATLDNGVSFSTAKSDWSTLVLQPSMTSIIPRSFLLDTIAPPKLYSTWDGVSPVIFGVLAVSWLSSSPETPFSRHMTTSNILRWWKLSLGPRSTRDLSDKLCRVEPGVTTQQPSKQPMLHIVSFLWVHSD